VFTTRPDTLFGSTFFVLAPEHPLVEQLASRSPNGDQIRDYVRIAGAKRGEERAASEAKSGVFTGFFATNPVNEARAADLGRRLRAHGLRHGRDHGRARARRARLPVRADLRPARQAGRCPGRGRGSRGRGVHGPHGERGAVDSAQFSGLPAPEAKRAIVEWLDSRGRGKPAINFRLRDWGFSRQRYWGCPIPIVYCDECGIVPVPDDQLPVLLPEIEDYRPKGHAPLASAEDWVNVPCPRCGKPAKREVDTMDTFVDSSWYFLRYIDPHNDHAPYDREVADYWGPVDFYQGGVDHATVHMIYARFYMKALNDLGLIGFREPFIRFHGNGWVQLGGTKMSKSKGNVVGPDQFVDAYGADPTRLYSLFIAPADQDMEFTETGLRECSASSAGCGASCTRPRRPSRAWRAGPLTRKAHETIAKVTDDIGRREAFNTPIAAVMELLNELSRDVAAPDARFAAETAVSLLQPYAPHVTEELWERLGHERLWKQPWPRADETQLRRDTFELVLQVNGKVRDRIQAPATASQAELIALAKASPRIQEYVNGKPIRREIVVPGKLVNLVI
jgi:leucyl-tRNA synthetase